MKKSDIIFIFAVIIMSGLYIGLTIQHFTQLSYDLEFQKRSTSTGGKPRDIDVDKFRRLIQMRELSDHEAEFYKPFTGSPEIIPLPSIEGEQRSSTQKLPLDKSIILPREAA